MTLPARTSPRLLPAEPLGLKEFEARYGPRPAGGDRVLRDLEESSLTGRGGAGFPTARKLRAVRAGRGAVVVANGTGGEPVSRKDAVLLERNPHLVIDGALLAADLVRAERVVLAVGRRALRRQRSSRPSRTAATPAVSASSPFRSGSSPGRRVRSSTS